VESRNEKYFYVIILGQLIPEQDTHDTARKNKCFVFDIFLSSSVCPRFTSSSRHAPLHYYFLHVLFLLVVLRCRILLLRFLHYHFVPSLYHSFIPPHSKWSSAVCSS